MRWKNCCLWTERLLFLAAVLSLVSMRYYGAPTVTEKITSSSSGGGGSMIGDAHHAAAELQRTKAAKKRLSNLLKEQHAALKQREAQVKELQAAVRLARAQKDAAKGLLAASARQQQLVAAATNQTAGNLLPVAAAQYSGKVGAVGTKATRNECPSAEKPKQVISFALFNKHGAGRELAEWIMIGVEQNRVGWHFYLPGWTVRVYIGRGISQNVVDRLSAVAASDPYFEIRLVGQVMYFDTLLDELAVVKSPNPQYEVESPSPAGVQSNFHEWMMYRFLVADDPMVERFVVRDLDGRPSIRDVLAINDWIRSGRSFHLIRDHRLHRKIPVMGGMWGATNQLFPRMRRRENGTALATMSGLITNFTAERRETPGGFTDQDFLRTHLWGRVAADTWAHDIMPHSQLCAQSGGCHLIPDSVRWDEFFIGAPFKVSSTDRVLSKSLGTRNYQCWSTCTMGPPMTCECKAKTYVFSLCWCHLPCVCYIECWYACVFDSYSMCAYVAASNSTRRSSRCQRTEP
jgi:hypothetical protein